MKIRMKDNTLRLRLSHGETEQFGREGIVTTITRFGNSPDAFLSYSLVKDEKAEAVYTTFGNNEIKVLVPGKLAAEWLLTNRTGFEENIPLNVGNSLFVLVEKDFPCLHKEPKEDDSDPFPDPFGNGAGQETKI